LLPGTVEATGENIMINTEVVGSQMSVPVRQCQVNPNDNVALAVRPEKLQITNEAPGDGYNGLRGKLIAESYAGDRSYYYLEVAGLPRRLAVTNLNEHPSANRMMKDNAEEVWVVWPIESGLLLTS
jgi:putrescine transport system ATP-binding protein